MSPVPFFPFLIHTIIQNVHHGRLDLTVASGGISELHCICTT